MKLIKFCIIFCFVFLSYLHIAYGAFEITEIMYDLDGTDTDREWVEVKNTGSEASDLSKWYLFSDNTKHALVPQGESMVPAGGYAVIVQNYSKFVADWSNTPSLVFDSSWTGFNNEEGETISLKDVDLNVVSPVTFSSNMGANGDGKSLQNISGSWLSGNPTPGSANQTQLSTSGDNNNTEATTFTSSSTPSTVIIMKAKEPEVTKINTSIICKTTVIAGLPFFISDVTSSSKKEIFKVGKFLWNFGDGTVKEDTGSQSFTHTYSYPGEYVLTLDYYLNTSTINPDATDRLIIKVIPSEVNISSVGSGTDTFVELENKSSIEVDLSGWYIQSSTNTFVIPKGTVILPNKKIRFSPMVTMFTEEDVKTISLHNPSGENMVMIAAKQNASLNSRKQGVNPVVKSNSINLSSPEVIDLDTLGASANKAQISLSSSTLAWLGFIILILLSTITIMLIHKKNPANIDEDKIKAEDIKIME